jgi:hypothetical protein
LRAFALRKPRNGLSDDDLLEMPRLLVIGESCFSRKDFIEEELARLGGVLVNLKLLHARLVLCLRKKVLQQSGNGGFLAGIGLPKCRYNQALVFVAGGHDVSPRELAVAAPVGDGPLVPVYVSEMIR